MRLTPAFSAYLDAIRVLAALVVVIGHASAAGFGPWGDWAGQFGHTMVLVFFVLSGYIVARTTRDGQIDGRTYLILRATRVYVVAVPAIMLSLLVSQWLLHQHPDLARADPNWQPLSAWNVASSLFFLNESWNNPAALSLNAPFWSLCYEVWYYAFFYCLHYLTGTQRLLAAGGVLLVAGPEICALLPVWLMGAALAGPRFDSLALPGWRWLAMVLPLVLVALVVGLQVDLWVKHRIGEAVPVWWRLGVSTKVATDIPLAALLALHLLAAHAWLAGRPPGLLARHRRVIRGAAGASFSLYVFHDPMLRGLAGFKAGNNGLAQFLTAVLFVVAAAWALSRVTEAKTPAARALFSGLPRRSSGLT